MIYVHSSSNVSVCRCAVPNECTNYIESVHRLRVFGNRVLKRMFGAKKKKVAGVWRRQHNEDLHNLTASPNIIRVIESRRMIWAGM
jgi:hypothetical protein